MVRKLILFIALLLIGLAAAGWFYRDTEPVRGWLPAQWRANLEGPAAGAKGKPAANAAVPRADGLRKCRQGNQVLYTNGDCPKGSVEQGIAGGTVTVVPGPQGAAAPDPSKGAAGTAANKSGLGPQTVRDMMGESQGRDLTDKKIDRAVGK